MPILHGTKMDMICLKLLLNIALIFIAKATEFNISTDRDIGNCTIASRKNRLSLNVIEPMSYDITFNIRPNYDSIFGTCHIIIRVYRQTRNILLHAYQIRLSMDKIELTTVNKTTDFVKKYVPVEYRYCKISQALKLRFKNNIPPALYYLKLSFFVPLRRDESKNYRHSSKRREIQK